MPVHRPDLSVHQGKVRAISRPIAGAATTVEEIARLVGHESRSNERVAPAAGAGSRGERGRVVDDGSQARCECPDSVAMPDRSARAAALDRRAAALVADVLGS